MREGKAENRKNRTDQVLIFVCSVLRLVKSTKYNHINLFLII